MGTNILGIGQTALAAAQLGISTTGHNIANASTPGFNRQVLLQTAAEPQNLGGSFVGQGVSVTQIQRQYNQFTALQVNSSQSSKNQVDSYYAQISQINNLVADPTAGVTPALQDFFSAVQNLASSPNGTAGAAARQAALSSAQSLVGRLTGVQQRLDQISTDVNGQIGTSIGSINTYASQLAQLNDTIEKATSVSQGSPPNDLLDQRDQLITELSKFTKVTVVPQDSKYNVFIGNGQPLVLGASANLLQASQSLTDPTRVEISYVANGKTIQIAENGLPGGSLGGLLDFRANMLDTSQNSIGRVAIGIATAFNDQHKLGQDLTGQVGADFFNVATPISKPSSNNTSTALISASISDASALTTSDYRMQFDGTNYKITRLADGAVQTTSSLPLKMDGVTFALAPPPAAAVPAAGDEFLIRPTAAGAANISVRLTDPSKIAVASSLTTTVPTTNTGTAKFTGAVVNSAVASASTSATSTISAVTTDDSYTGTTLAAPLTLSYASPNLTGFPAGATVSVKVGAVTTNYPPPATVPYTNGATISFSGVSFSINNNGATPPTSGDTFTLSASLPVAATKLTFNSAGNTLTGFPATANVTVTNGGTSTTYPAGTPVPYTSGATISYSGFSVTLSGSPANGDVFNISPNVTGTGDNRNALLLAGLQTQNALAGKTTTIQGAYAQFVSFVGNKANELSISSVSETKLLAQAVATQQSESGVNLDEEAANLLRYQQAYQAAGKLMQIASQLFDALLAIGR
ncbi:flagellar hook-associated protein FlgK [Undibacterium sp. SXout7W]|uniref:flagellar hook-associated protein FlgK n=1 Tax=Undibacterium sp. SXout7W TaxID=3413049 RepID=UPI003BF2E4FD